MNRAYLLKSHLVLAAFAAAVAVVIALGIGGLLGVVVVIGLAALFALLGLWAGRLIVRRKDGGSPPS